MGVNSSSLFLNDMARGGSSCTVGAMSNRPKKRKGGRHTAPLSENEEDAFNDFVRRFRRETLPKMKKSSYVMSLLPNRDGVDVKFAVELGMAIMLDKPIVAVVQPGVPVPRRLRLVVDDVLELAADLDSEAGRDELVEKLSAFHERMDSDD